MNAIIIFIRNPILGKVKTRLAREIGDLQALQIYNQLLNITRDVSLESHAIKYLFYSDFIENDDEWDSNYNKMLQTGNDLGERMKVAFQSILQRHSKCIIIGSDCPYISEKLIESAFTSLDQNDVVIGPAKDGGYYLLGMNKLILEIFTDMAWSQQHLLTQTKAKLDELNYSYCELDILEDIDTLKEWENYKKSINQSN